MRQLAAILGLAALAAGFAGTASADTDKERRKQEQKLARIMALAEADFALRRAELGLAGSTLGGVDLRSPAPRLRPASDQVESAVTPVPVSAPLASGDGSLR